MLAIQGPLWAQEEAPAKKPAKKAAAADKAPAAAAPKAATSHAAGDENIPVIVVPNPGVEAILANNPRTPEELTRSAKILADLGRPDLAKGFLRRVLAAEPGQKQLAAMVQRYGSPMFTAMAGRADLNPEGKQLAALALDAAERESRDPQKLEALIHQLQDPSADARYAAADSLAHARGAAVGPLLAVLADPGRAAEHGNAKVVLLRLAGDAVRPLVGALECDNPRIVARAAETLGALKAQAATDFLLAPYASAQSTVEVRKAAGEALESLLGQVPSRIEAAQRLAERAGEYFNHRHPLHEDIDGQLELWTWDEAARGPVARRVPVDDARRMLAARYAREAYAVRPDDESVRLVYLATMLEQASFANGLGSPLPVKKGSPAATAAAFGPDVLESVLALAVKDGHPAAAAAAARLLGRVGSADQLLYRSALPGPLVEATRNPDRRLRLAAAEAILRLKPTRPFAGSNQVTEALAFLINTSGRPRAVVADPSNEEARRVGGYLSAMGYQVDTATRGREVVRMAIDCPDYELVLASASIEQPSVDILTQQLRHDCRSALLPVGVLARDGQMERAKHLAGEDPLSVALVRPHRQQDAKEETEQVLALAGVSAVGSAERGQQAASALAMLQDLSASPATIFDVRRYEPAILAAQGVPELAARSAVALGDLGSARSQKALVDQASRTTLPLPVRQAALAAFRCSTEKYGILLTTDGIRQQYDRYNQSKELDAENQQIFGQILDALEAPAQRLKATGSPEAKRAAKAHAAAVKPKSPSSGGLSVPAAPEAPAAPKPAGS
jgi:HEAT repeat protein